MGVIVERPGTVDRLTDGTRTIEFTEGVKVDQMGRIITLTAKKPIGAQVWWHCDIEIGALRGRGRVIDIDIDRGNGLESIRLVLDAEEPKSTTSGDATARN